MKATSIVNGKEVSIYWEEVDERNGYTIFLWGIDDEGIEYKAMGYQLDGDIKVYDHTIEII